MEDKVKDNLKMILDLIETKQYRRIRNLLDEMNEVDIAAMLEELPCERVSTVFRTLPKETAAEVFSHLSTERQHVIIETITDNELSEIIDDLFVDDAVDMLEELPANVVKRVLKNANPKTRFLINQFLKYPENSAGSIMTAEFVDLKRNMKVYDAFLRIRRTGIDKETVYTCYVTDNNRRLLGVVTVKDLLLSNDEELIGDIMDDNLICASTSTDREEVANLFRKYDLLSMPVVDHDSRLVGIVTVDDVVQVIEEEATEDFEKMAAILPSEKPYLKTTVLDLAKNRIPWLLVLMVSAMVTGKVLERFELAFATLPLLVTFIPMLTDTGGNAGSQSATLIIRGMAISEIKTKDIFKVFTKELGVSVLVGFVLSVVNYIRLIIMYPTEKLVAFTVVVSLYATVIIAKTIGGILPMVAKFFKADPAIMAAPLITTIVDAFSLVFFFTMAQILLGI